MTSAQRASVARFFYDVSKGAILAVLIGMVTGKIVLLPAIAANCFRLGYLTEGEDDG